jgi:hypothetical protein
MVGGASAFAGGDGSSSDPYEINTCQQLQDMNNDLDENYELISDVDCSGTSSWNGGKGFKPINIFTGVFNGKGYAIKDLYIDRPSGRPVGFIGNNKGVVKKVKVLNVDIEEGYFEVGGVVGLNNNLVTQTMSTGNIDGTQQVGGVVGKNKATVSYSYSHATVYGSDYNVGGFVGRHPGTSKKSYSTGSASAGGGNEGGFIGSNFGSVSDSYWDTQSSGLSTTDGSATGLTTSQMTYPNSESNMPGFNFGGIWKRDLNNINNGYPVLCFEGQNQCNQKPQFNSSSITPDHPLIGESVSYSAEVSDSDGSVSYTNLSLSYGGSTVLSDVQRSGTNTPEWNDVYTPQSGDKWLNASLEVVDDAGAVTEKQINRYLSDDAPSVSIQNPRNQTYFKYGVPLDVSVSDSDSNPNEDWSCSVDKDGQQVDSFNLVEGTNSSYSSTIESDLGTHTVDVSCSDGSGNTDTASNSYTVDSAEIESVYGATPVYETENRTFEVDLKTGEMVNSVDFELVYDGGSRDTKSMFSDGVETLRPNLYHEIPLVNSNQTSKNWRIDYKLNISEFQSSTTSTTQESTSAQSQEVLWSYWIKNSETNPANGRYIEREDLKHNVSIATKTKKADISGTTEYNRTSETTEMNQIINSTDSETFQGVIDTGNASNFNQSTFGTSSTINLSFNGGSRSLNTAEDEVKVFKIRLDKCSSGDSATALNFQVFEETDLDNKIRSDLDMEIDVWKTGEIERSYAFGSENKTNHYFCIKPSWAEYQASTVDKLIQFTDDADEYVLRSHFLFPQTINNDTKTVDLYSLKKTDAVPIGVELTNEAGESLTGKLVRIRRYFPSQGRRITVAMLRTGNNGRSETYLQVNEIYYSFKFYNQTGYLIGERPDQVISQDLLSFRIGAEAEPSYYEYKDQISSDCQMSNTEFTCTWDSKTEDLQNITLKAEKMRLVGSENECVKYSSSVSGSLACTGLNMTKNQYRLSLVAEFSNGQKVPLYSTIEGDRPQKYGDAGLMLTMFLTLTLGLAGIRVPSLSIILSVIGVIASWMVGWFPVPTTFIMSLVVIESYVIYRFRRS